MNTITTILRRYRWLVFCLWALVAWVVGFTEFCGWLLQHRLAGVLFLVTGYLCWKDER